MNPEHLLVSIIQTSLKKLIPAEALPEIVLQKTKKEFEGDFTLVCFPYTRFLSKSPKETAELIGLETSQHDSILDYNVINGFLNIRLHLNVWSSYFRQFNPQVSGSELKSTKVMVEYSSPNTNKPLHLGHIRNNLLGLAVSRILKESGKEVIMVNLINDRGIHICKSMYAWLLLGNGETPQSSGIKGDHLVGKYYVAFDQLMKGQREQVLENWNSGVFDAQLFNEEVIKKAKTFIELIQTSTDSEKKKNAEADLNMLAGNNTHAFKQAQEMLVKWEQNEPEVKNLWEKMNGWVYDGFEITYKRLGVHFDKIYYESQTYLLGKKIVDLGLHSGTFTKKPDNSVWIDLSAEGLDQKLLLRADGTSVYITQDMGTALMRHEEYQCSNYIYVVGNEQDYHFNVLAKILSKMGYSWADGIFHLSYGMVDLPSGKMKSREGTVVDADDLMEEIVNESRKKSEELGKLEGMSDEEKKNLYEILGMGALKYYILKVDPKKRMVFNPEESIDLNGNTGPFIQYAYARIQSLMRKTAENGIHSTLENINEATISNHIDVIKTLHQYEPTVKQAAESLNPSAIANYAFELAKEFNQFYHDYPILKETDLQLASFRLSLSIKVGETLKKCLYLLGIEVPHRM